MLQIALAEVSLTSVFFANGLLDSDAVNHLPIKTAQVKRIKIQTPINLQLMALQSFFLI